MFQTIQLSSRISVQGEHVADLDNGEIVVRDGHKIYRGRPILCDGPLHPSGHAATAFPGHVCA